MLYLDRHLGESITIYTAEGLKVTVMICHIQRGQVKLGIKAPPQVGVDREEIFYRKHPELKPA